MMKLLLRQDVKDLGRTGEVVSVRDGYARNFLLPRRLAMEVTAANLRTLEDDRKRALSMEAERIKDFKVLAERLSNIDITLHERVHDGDQLYGAVSAKEIVDELVRVSRIQIDMGWVDLETPIKTLGVHRVKISPHHDVAAELKVWIVEKKGV